MSDTAIQTATEQPAPVAQSSEQKSGPANATEADFARRFMKPQAAPKSEAKVETPPPAEKQETAEAAPIEAVPTETEAVEETPLADVEDKTEDVLSKSNSLTPEQQAIIDKRIGKAVAKQRKAERDTAELKLRLAELEAAQPKPTQVDSPIPAPSITPQLTHIQTVDGLQKLQSEARQAIRFAEDALAEMADGNPAPEGFDKKTLRDVMRNARVTLEDHIPARAQFLTERQKMQQQAYEVLPFLKDRASQEYREVQLIYQRHPFLREMPEGDFTAGLILKGIKAVEAERAAAGAKPAPNKPVISRPTPTAGQAAVSSSGSERVGGQTAAQRAAAGELASLTKKGGASAGDYAHMLSLRSQLRNSP